MRGEETQVVGASVAGMDNGVFVMPGTHSKWVSVVGGRIENYKTFMTGEVFGALRSHTILGTLMVAGPFNKQGFRKGVQTGLKSGTNLLHELFYVRTMPLFGKIATEMVADYLSGMLIGAEIAAEMSGKDFDGSVAIIGRGDLADRYEIALDEAGIENLMKIIHTLGDETNVFVISHKGEVLDGKFANKLEFVKDKNFSKLKSAA